MVHQRLEAEDVLMERASPVEVWRLDIGNDPFDLQLGLLRTLDGATGQVPNDSL
jgi:hypothetical protein